MISNITLGKSGLPEYLVSGRKVGSEYSRDEKDHRLLIDGSEEALKDSIFSGRRQASRGCARIFTLKFSKSQLDEIIYHAEAHVPKILYEPKRGGAHTQNLKDDLVERHPISTLA